MEQPRKFNPRPAMPPKPPETITGAARRYHACAVALANSLGISLVEVLEMYSESVSTIFIETSRCDLRLPERVKLPPLNSMTPQVSPAEVQTPALPPADNGHTPEDATPPPPRGSEAQQRETLLHAIARELLDERADGKHWQGGWAKALCRKAFGVSTWAELQGLHVEHLREGYATVQQQLTRARLQPSSTASQQHKRPDDVPDFDPPAATKDSKKSAADELVGTNKTVKTAHVPSNGQTPPVLTADQEALKAEALSWGLPEAEVLDIVRRYRVEAARELLWNGRELRRKPAARD